MDNFLPFAGMIFALLTLLIIVGAILMFPLTRRLGALLELRAEERRREQKGTGAATSDLQELRDAVSALQEQVAKLTERQEFADRLLEPGERAAPAPRDS